MMALARKCTRCGRYYDDYEGEYQKDSQLSDKPYNAILLVDADLDRKHWNRLIIDLCIPCKQSFEGWYQAIMEATHET